MKNLALLVLMTLSLAVAAGEPGGAEWVVISDSVVNPIVESGKKIGYPGGTAGVCVDPADGTVFMVVPDHGIWKSTDQGATFTRADSGQIGGRCETGYALNMDPAGGGRLACFMLDGKCAMTLDGGKSWRPFAGVGRNWDFAAVDWSKPEPLNIFAALHESGGKYYLSTDAGAHWTKLGEEKIFDLKGGVGIFDASTLVMTKGEGILRSMDAGVTWTKVSEHTPTGRVVQIYKNVAYWLSSAGLLVSSDKGATWTVQGSPTTATLGPWFKDETHLSAAGIKGIVESKDAGKTWTPVAPLPPKFTMLRAGWFVTIGWDAQRGIYYASQMGKATYRWGK